MHLSSNPPTLEVRGVRALNDRGALAVQSVSLDVRPGEVVGVAGVDGSGQTELAEAIVGLRHIAGGGVWLDGEEITRLSAAARMKRGMAYVPEDRQRDGLVLDFSIAENMILGRQREPTCCGGRTLDLRCMAVKGEMAVREHRIRAGGGDVIARTLSGGNQQKVVLARALDGQPRLLVAMQPTRGLDVEATRFVYDTLRKALLGGMGILLFSLDLDELFEISTRIAVMYNGTLAGIVPRREATPDGIGKLMVSGSGPS
jgi:simple sugar transport system ATP-binding protein